MDIYPNLLDRDTPFSLRGSSTVHMRFDNGTVASDLLGCLVTFMLRFRAAVDGGFIRVSQLLVWQRRQFTVTIIRVSQLLVWQRRQFTVTIIRVSQLLVWQRRQVTIIIAGGNNGGCSCSTPVLVLQYTTRREIPETIKTL
jgi:hypothetical protein